MDQYTVQSDVHFTTALTQFGDQEETYHLPWWHTVWVEESAEHRDPATGLLSQDCRHVGRETLFNKNKANNLEQNTQVTVKIGV